MIRNLATFGLVLAMNAMASAALIVNAPLPIVEKVTVKPILVRNSDGTNAAEYFGSDESSVKSLVNQIWAQAGIEIEFLLPSVWNNTYANTGDIAPGATRTGNDLSWLVTNGDAAGVGSNNPLVLDIYFVEIAAGFPDVSENTANGLAFVGGNGISQHVGDNLPGFLGGREVIASVVAHEIGHNLGLDHIVENFNLLQAGGSTNRGQQLNASQISTALASQFSVIVAVPEPSSLILLASVGIAVRFRRLKQMTARH